MRDYVDRRVCKIAYVNEGYVFTPPNRVTSPTWGSRPPCKQAIKGHPGVLILKII